MPELEFTHEVARAVVARLEAAKALGRPHIIIDSKDVGSDLSEQGLEFSIDDLTTAIHSLQWAGCFHIFPGPTIGSPEILANLKLMNFDDARLAKWLPLR